MLKTSVAAYLSGSRVLMAGPAVSDAAFAWLLAAGPLVLAFAFEFAFASVVVTGLQPLIKSNAAVTKNAPTSNLKRSLCFCVRMMHLSGKRLRRFELTS